MKIEKFNKLVGDDYNVVCRCLDCNAAGYFCDLRPSEDCKRKRNRKKVGSGCDDCKELKMCGWCQGRGEFYRYCEPTPEGLM